MVKNMKKSLACFLLLSVLLTGCVPARPSQPQRYESTYLTLFDTVTSIVGYADSEETFRRTSQQLHDEMLEYHQLFDIYNDYEGINNLKTVNDNAGGEPIKVDEKIIDLLLFCQELAQKTGGKVDVTMGSVLRLWHEARQAGLNDPDHAALPDPQALEAASAHVGFSLLEIDAEAGTLRLTDPDARLDVGAVAKGYATEQVSRRLPSGYLLSVGGNVRSTGSKPDGSQWVVGIQDPDHGNGYLHTLYVADASAVVTSGDYQRYYTVDGVRYHHIIDPETHFPATRWRAVTILCPDSGLADGLSTALFLMDQETGAALLKEYDAQAMWVALDGTLLYSDGFQTAIHK